MENPADDWKGRALDEHKAKMLRWQAEIDKQETAASWATLACILIAFMFVVAFVIGAVLLFDALLK